MAAPILELRNVNKSFGPIDVLHDITLKVDAGEVLCLLGDNGAGKSTLIKVLSGVHKPTSGTVLMDGKAVSFPGPRDAQGQLGPYEASLMGNPVADSERPLEVVRTIHSFDPCLACAIHAFDPEGNETATVKVLGG